MLLKDAQVDWKTKHMKKGPEDNNRDESSESDEITSMYISRHFSMERTDECKKHQDSSVHW